MKLPSLLAVTLLLTNFTLLRGSPGTADEQARVLLSQMTLDEKIGQMTQVDSDALKGHEQDVATYFLGSILSGGNSNPPGGSSASSWKDLVAKLDGYAAQTRLKIPVFYGIDAVHGNNNVTSATIFPHNVGLGATRNPALVEKAARVTAEEVAGIGVDWAFAPCVAVGRDLRWGRSYESFGEDPGLVASLGAAAVRGLQGGNSASRSSVLACTKHFLGDGGTANGRDQGDTQMDLATLRKIHLPAYAAAIQAGTQSIMVSYSSWNGMKMHAQRELITGVLKDELKFQGFVVSDWAAIDQISPDYKDCVEQSINAGIDMVMIPYDSEIPPSDAVSKAKLNTYFAFIETLKSLVAEGKVPVSRIDDAVVRILRAKFMCGLFEGHKGSPELLAAIGSAAHREVARQCVRESLVLLQNRHDVLPLSKQARRIGVTGRGANNLNMQCGGWTLDWQSFNGQALLGATTVLDAVRAAVSPETQVVYSPDGTRLGDCDVVIAVVGEESYAEYKGDRQDLQLDPVDLQVISNARRGKRSVVAVLLSGRPLLIDPLLAECDGVLAAWLPGSEGAGVADVLFGDYRPTGKLPRTWPRSMNQVSLVQGDENYDPLFKFGFGLTYP